MAQNITGGAVLTEEDLASKPQTPELVFPASQSKKHHSSQSYPKFDNASPFFGIAISLEASQGLFFPLKNSSELGAF